MDHPLVNSVCLLSILVHVSQCETYTKYASGRRVCSSKMQDQEALKVTVPSYQQFTQKCFHNQICKGVRLTYETKYECCPGWSQSNKLSHGCNQAVCSRPCENGGKCVAPEICSCVPGYGGPYCEADLNECDLTQPCSHDCTNVHGSFLCRCPTGHKIDADKRTCVKDWTKVATEAHDLEIEFINPNRKNFKKKNKTKNDCEITPNDQPTQHGIQILETKIEGMKKSHEKIYAALESKISQLFSKVELLQQRLQNCAACDFGMHRQPNFIEKLRKNMKHHQSDWTWR